MPTPPPLVTSPRRGRPRFAPIPLAPERFPFPRRGGPVCPPGYVILPGPAHGPTHRLAPTEPLAAAINPRKPGGDRAPPRRGRPRFAPIPLAPERRPSPRRGGPVCPHGHDFLAGPAYGPTHRSAPTESLAAAIDPGKPGRAEHRPCRPAPVPPVGGGLRPAPPGKAAFCTDPVGFGTLPSPRRGGPVCPPGHVIFAELAQGPTHRSAPTESLAAAINPGNLGGGRAPPLPSGSGPHCRGRAPPCPAGEGRILHRSRWLRNASPPCVGADLCVRPYAILPEPAHGPTHRSAPTESLATAINPGKPGGDGAPPLPSDRGAQQYLWHDLRHVGEAPMPKSPLFSIPSF